MTSRARRVTVIGAWVAAGVLGAGALTGVALAAEGAGTPAGPTGTAAAAAPGPAAGAGAIGRLGRLQGRVLHGQLTVRTTTGVRTVDTQLGTVTAVSATSLAVRSSDGFTLTWTVDTHTKVRKDRRAASVTDLAKGDTVRVVGPATGQGATARLVVVPPVGAPAVTG